MNFNLLGGLASDLPIHVITTHSLTDTANRALSTILLTQITHVLQLCD